eukprot:Awhi_evm1s14341
MGNTKNYFGVVYMPVSGKERYWRGEVMTELSSVYNNLINTGNVWILGDFNARVGSRNDFTGDVINVNGEGRSNKEWEDLIDWLHTNRMRIYNNTEDKECQYTRCQRGEASIIDYIIGGTYNIRLVKRVTVDTGKEITDIGSDHFLLYGSLRCDRYKKQVKKSFVKWDVEKLNDSVQTKEIKKKLNEKFKTMAFHPRHDWFNYNDFQTELNGNNRKNTKRNRDSKKENDNKWKEIKKLNDQITESMRQFNKEKWEKFSESITEKLGPKEFLSLLKRIGGHTNGSKMGGIKVQDGRITNNSALKRKAFAEHYKGLGNGKPQDDGQYDSDFRKMVEKEILSFTDLTNSNPSCNELDDFFSKKEVSEVYLKLKKHKAGGIDGITNELLTLTANTEEGIVVLTDLVNKFWREETVPQQLELGRIINIFKDGEESDMNNYRGITLLSAMYKLLTSLMCARVTKFSEKENLIDETQGGFRSGRGCTDQLYVLNKIVEHRLSKNKLTLLSFIGIGKAFDRVWRDGIFHQLYKGGVQGKMFRMIQEIYKNNNSVVNVDDLDSDEFGISMGVRQGDVFSPFLFAIFINGLIKEIKNLGIPLDEDELNYMVHCLLYADDCVLIAKNTEDMKKLLDCLNGFCKKWRIDINSKKSATLELGLPINNSYKYLGVYVNDKWNWNTHVNYVNKKVKKKLEAIRLPILRNSNLGTKAKLTVWNTMIKPIVLYGSEIWWTNKTQLLVLERLQLKAAKWILGCCDKTINEVVLRECGLASLESQMFTLKLNWTGKCTTFSGDRLFKKVMDLTNESSNRRKGSTKVVNEMLEESVLTDQFDGLADESILYREWVLMVKKEVRTAHYNKWLSVLKSKSKGELCQEIHEREKLRYREC